MNWMGKYTYISTLLIVGLIFTGCRKRDQYIPYVEVDIYVNINNPSYSQLTSITGWAYLNGGSKGLIAYRKSQEEILVFDRHCTFEAEKACGKADVNDDNVTVDCICDGSKYLLQDGSIINGPAPYPLFEYRTTFDGAILHIFN
jgi:nitrite reductase/ring-hydroxylating ferredoxin subunit